MDGMKDWNTMSIDEHIKHLENEFQFDSSGTAKSVYELISAYKSLTINDNKDWEVVFFCKQYDPFKNGVCKTCGTNHKR